MKFILTSTAILSALFIQIQAQIPVSVSVDNIYDNRNGSTLTVACSNGPNGLVSKFPTFGSFFDFPNIGGASVISGFGSVNCGTCWQLEFEGDSINIAVINVAPPDEFKISQEAFETWTNGQAGSTGPINATATQVAAAACGL